MQSVVACMRMHSAVINDKNIESASNEIFPIRSIQSNHIDWQTLVAATQQHKHVAACTMDNVLNLGSKLTAILLAHLSVGNSFCIRSSMPLVSMNRVSSRFN